MAAKAKTAQGQDSEKLLKCLNLGKFTADRADEVNIGPLGTNRILPITCIKLNASERATGKEGF